MRWLADECVAAGLVALLRADGHDVVYVAEAAAGLSDADVITLASREMRVLLTEDKDFGDLVFRRERAVPGVVLLRIAPENPASKGDEVGGGDRAIWRRAFWPLRGDRGSTFSISPPVGVRTGAVTFAVHAQTTKEAEYAALFRPTCCPNYGLEPVSVKDTDHYKVMREFCEDPEGFVEAVMEE